MYTRRWTQPRGNNTYDIRPRSRALACKHYAYTYTMGYYVTTICTTGMVCSKRRLCNAATSPNMVILRRATKQSPHYIERLGIRRHLAARAHTERRRRNGGRQGWRRQEWTQQWPVEAFEERRRVGRGCTGRRERNGRPSPDPPERKIDRRPPGRAGTPPTKSDGNGARTTSGCCVTSTARTSGRGAFARTPLTRGWQRSEWTSDAVSWVRGPGGATTHRSRNAPGTGGRVCCDNATSGRQSPKLNYSIGNVRKSNIRRQDQRHYLPPSPPPSD